MCLCVLEVVMSLMVVLEVVVASMVVDTSETPAKTLTPVRVFGSIWAWKREMGGLVRVNMRSVCACKRGRSREGFEWGRYEVVMRSL